MQKSELKILAYCLAMCVVTGSVVFWLSAKQEKKIAVVDAVKLFDGYNMKKELEGIENVKLQKESKELDSMDKAAQMAKAVSPEDEQTKKLVYTYAYMKSKLEKDYTDGNHNINEQVWKRLNPLMDAFGKNKGLHLIVGANGMGSVLYNDEYYDLTNEAINYVNKRYAEGN